MIGFGLALVLVMAVGLVGSLLPAPAVGLVLAAASFVAVGFITLHIRPAATPLEPAIGAALMVLLLSIPQLMSDLTQARALSPAQVTLSVLVSVVFAFSLTWFGARLAAWRGTSTNTPHQDASSSA